jgi:uncharacterized protein
MDAREARNDANWTEQAAWSGPFSRKRIGSVITPRLQELILLPTEKCNFRCTYCYEDFAIGRMSATVQRSVELFVERRIVDLAKLRFSWFGGEPLLAQDVVTRLSRHAFETAKAYGVDFQGGLTTNAYLLTPDLFDELLSYKQNFYQITLDGWGDTHNQVRKLANGRPSFDRIWNNMIAMAAHRDDFEVLIRVHLRRDNLDNVRLLMKEVRAQFGNDPRFRVDFEHLRDLGGDGGKTVLAPLSIAETKQIGEELHAILRSGQDDVRVAQSENLDLAVAQGKQFGESAAGQRSSDIDLDGPYICYAAKANSLLVRADGRVGKCTVALNDDRNTIGSLRPDGTVQIDNAKLRPWLRGLESLEEAELGCPLFNLGRTIPSAPDEDLARQQQEIQG